MAQNYKRRSNQRRQAPSTRRPSQEATPQKGQRSFTDYVGSTNDISWYNKNPQLINDAAKIPFGNQLGRTLEVNTNGTSVYQVGGVDIGWPQNFKVPGVMGLDMVCTPGIAREVSDGVNIATSLTFQKIRKELSTYAQYAPADIMMYIMGIDSIYTQYANILRAFGIVQAYSAANLYLPDAVLRAGYGFSSVGLADFKANLNTYRTQFNQLIYKASTLYLPVDFTIMSRHSWLFSNYFVDNVSAKAQIYIHRLIGAHELDETSSQNGTALAFVKMPVAGTMADYLDQFDQCIEKYRNSDSMLKIAADMRRAFNDSSVWKLAYVDENYIVLPIADRTVLTQIHNTVPYPTGVFNDVVNAQQNNFESGFNIYQSVDKNTVRFDPEWTFATSTDADKRKCLAVGYLISPQLLDFNEPEITTEMIIEGTRDICIGEVYKPTPSSPSRFRLLACGADLCVGYRLVELTATGTPFIYSIDNIYLDPIGSGQTAADSAKFISLIAMFNWAPRFIIGGLSTSTKESTYLFTQLDNFTTVEPRVLAQLNNNIMCSMWDVPSLGA